jgi:hypothetical protein
MAAPALLHATKFNDQRGALCAFPGFDLSEVVRMYAIEPASTSIIRAWQGHIKERKCFWVAAGSFEVQTILLGADHIPQLNARINWELSASQPAVLTIPGGHLNGFKSLEANSRLLVFSDFDLEASKADDIRFSLEEIPWMERG